MNSNARLIMPRTGDPRPVSSTGAPRLSIGRETKRFRHVSRLH
jgi:hypothetical protein